MSYGGYVNCNCYKEGKTSEPPHKSFVHFDDDEIYLDISSDFFEKNKEIVYNMDADFDGWKQTACEHEEMELAYEHLTNISGMEAFLHLLSKSGGEEKFPILTRNLPGKLGEILPNEFAQKVLDEISLLENDRTLEEIVELKEKSTGNIIATVSADTYWLFLFTPYNKNTFGIDKGGFFILENIKKNNGVVSYIAFRSKNFIQKKASNDHYLFMDLYGGDSFECSANLKAPEDDSNIDYEFEVKTERVKIAVEYEYIIAPLKRLARAALLSGNPIRWL
jgi:hypothetical protein